MNTIRTVCLCSQIKGTFQRTFSEAVKNYNSQDERSLAVDNVQRSVSDGDFDSQIRIVIKNGL